MFCRTDKRIQYLITRMTVGNERGTARGQLQMWNSCRAIVAGHAKMPTGNLRGLSIWRAIWKWGNGVPGHNSRPRAQRRLSQVATHEPTFCFFPQNNSPIHPDIFTRCAERTDRWWCWATSRTMAGRCRRLVSTWIWITYWLPVGVCVCFPALGWKQISFGKNLGKCQHVQRREGRKKI